MFAKTNLQTWWIFWNPQGQMCKKKHQITYRYFMLDANIMGVRSDSHWSKMSTFQDSFALIG